MKYEALLVNDLHIDRDNIIEFEKNWAEMVGVCDKHDIPVIIIGGDIFTTRNSQNLATIYTVKTLIEETAKERKIYIAPGNHDKPDYSQLISWCDVISCDNVRVIRTYKAIEFNNFTIATFAYFPEESELPDYIDEFLREYERPDAQPVIAYVHAGIHGSLGDFDVPGEADQELFKKFRYTLCGHYHNRCHIKGTSIYYIGSSRAHNFGEDEEKGYTLIDSDGEAHFCKNEVNTRYATEEIDFCDVNSWTRSYDDRYKVRLRISCTSAEADTIDKESLKERGANKIEFITEKLKAIKSGESDIEDKFDNTSILSEYLKFSDTKDIDSGMGVEYLKKIK